MTDRRIVRLADNAARVALARQWLLARSRQEHSELLILAPPRGAADDLVHSVAAQSGALFGLHRMTPIGLAAQLATQLMAARGLAPVSQLGVQALCARCAHDVSAGEGLRYFGPVAATPGFARALGRTLLELRLYDVPIESLRELGPPGEDLARLLTAFNAELSLRSLADWATLYELANVSDSALAGLPLLLLDTPPRSTAEARFLQKLVNAAPSVMATVMTQDDVAGLEAMLDCRAEDLDPQQAARALDRVRRDLFLSEVLTPCDSDDSIGFFSAAGEGRECIEIARQIRRHALTGLPFDQMAILLRNPTRYQPQLEEALRRAGVPGFFSGGTVRPDIAGRAFLALLECGLEGLSASGFAEYLSLGQVAREAPVPPDWAPPAGEQSWDAKPAADVVRPDTPAEETDESAVVAGTLRTPAHWEALLIDASVIGGRDRWQRRLAGLQQEMALKRKGLEEDSWLVKALERDLQNLQHLSDYALPLIGALDDLPQLACWGEWIVALRALAGMALRDASSVLAVLGELDPMAEVGPVGLAEVYEVLSGRLSQLRSRRPGRRYGQVFVGTPREAAGRSFELVFLPALCEGSFPQKISEDPLLLFSQREQIGCGLPDREHQSNQERLLLYIAAGAAARRLVISYPRADVVQGRARVPSFYALDVLRAAEGKLPDLRTLEKRAAESVEARHGWPAPSDPAEALDDAEFDLATLGPLMQLPGEQIKGQARFLLEANDHLKRSLRARYLRWQKPWSKADGLVKPDEQTRAALAKHRLNSRSYSPTALQAYAACPYRFMLGAIHRLRPREEAVSIERMDPLTRGSLFHEVQFELFGELRGRNMLPIREATIEAVIDLTDEVLDRVAGHYEDRLAPAIPRIWRAEMEDLRIDLRALVRRVGEERSDWLPIHAELAFGLKHHDEQRDPASSKQPAVILGGFKVRGSIDLVEKRKGVSPTTRPAVHPILPPSAWAAARSCNPCSTRWPPSSCSTCRWVRDSCTTAPNAATSTRWTCRSTMSAAA